MSIKNKMMVILYVHDNSNNGVVICPFFNYIWIDYMSIKLGYMDYLERPNLIINGGVRCPLISVKWNSYMSINALFMDVLHDH